MSDDPGGVRPLHRRRSTQPPRRARGHVPASGGPRRAAGGEPARHHPQRHRARRAGARARRRAHRRAHRRRAGGPGHHRRRGGRAGAGPPGAGPPTSARTRWSDPTSSRRSTPPSPTSSPPDAYHVVFECSGKRAAMEAGPRQLRRGGTARAGRRRHRAAPVRPEPHPAQRAHHHRRRSSTTPTASSVALELLAPGRSRSTCWSSPTTCPSTGCIDAMREPGRGPHRGQGDGRAPRQRGATMSRPATRPRTPRFNHVAMSLPADQLDDDGRGRIVRLLRRGVRLGGAPDMMTDDRQRLVLERSHLRAVRVPHRRGRADACPRLDHFGMSVGDARRARRRLERAKAFAEARRPGRHHRPEVDDHGCRQDPQLLRRLPAADDGRDAVLGVRRQPGFGSTGVTAATPVGPVPAVRRVRPPGMEARVRRAGRPPTRGTAGGAGPAGRGLGYDHLWVYDHVETVPRREPDAHVRGVHHAGRARPAHVDASGSASSSPARRTATPDCWPRRRRASTCSPAGG